MKIYTAIERQATDIPLSEIMIEGKFDIYKDVQAKQYFNISLKKDNLVLLAGNHVGLIPLNSKTALLVEPKIARNNWLHVVGKTNAYLAGLGYLRNYSIHDTASKSLIEFLSRALIQLAAPISEQGLLKLYEPVREKTSFPKGRILFGESIKHVWSKGFNQSVAIQKYLFSKDTPHNRLIKYALSIAIRNINFLLTSNLSLEKKKELSTLRASAKEIEDLLSAVPYDLTIKYIPEVKKSLESQSLPIIRDYYYDICQTSLLLVQNTGIIPHLEGVEETLSFVVNMEDVFEDYCRNCLRQFVQQNNWVEVVGGKDDQQRMFYGPNSDTRMAEPDIVIRLQNGEKYPVEVKYKEDPNRDNINQAITYAVTYKKTKAIIVCYATGKQTGLVDFGKVGEGIQVFVYHFDLEKTDIEAEEKNFASVINRLITE